jgi:chemotaxis protein histidine kinase CheA
MDFEENIKNLYKFLNNPSLYINSPFKDILTLFLDNNLIAMNMITISIEEEQMISIINTNTKLNSISKLSTILRNELESLPNIEQSKIDICIKKLLNILNFIYKDDLESEEREEISKERRRKEQEEREEISKERRRKEQEEREEISKERRRKEQEEREEISKERRRKEQEEERKRKKREETNRKRKERDDERERKRKEKEEKEKKRKERDDERERKRKEKDDERERKRKEKEEKERKRKEKEENEDEKTKRRKQKQREYRERVKEREWKKREDEAKRYQGYNQGFFGRGFFGNTFGGFGGSAPDAFQKPYVNVNEKVNNKKEDEEEKKYKEDLEKNKDLINGDQFRCVSPYKRGTDDIKVRLKSCKQEGNFAKGFPHFFGNKQQCTEYCNTE